MRHFDLPVNEGVVEAGRGRFALGGGEEDAGAGGGAQKMAPRHMGQGSQELYRSQPVSWKSPSTRQASRIATTSRERSGRWFGSPGWLPWQ